MNTSNIKKYAPQARNDFMQAVAKRLNQFGIYVSKTADENARINDVSIDGSVMQVDGNSFDASLAESRKKLVEQATQQGFNQFVEHTAYTWFNRLCAIRYMELHDYLEHGLRILSPSPTQGEGWGEGKLPEILDHAQDVAQDLGLNRDHIIELKLAGNQDEQLYRELLIGQCHQLHQAMPFLFEALDDATELLLPDNLTRTDSLLRGLVNDIPEQDWQQVEIIGWLYQFYISEKKDDVIGKVVKSEDIPAATQLFTPNWIVKYLVQNSVGRQWLQTYPDSSIKAEMEYYIEPAKQTEAVGAALAANTPDSIDPETIKVLDPACGSGHILVEAYQVLKSIYEERGYRSRDIPKLILENNLYGLDIDDRAAQLAGFALMMLARADDRRIFTRDVQLNVVAMQSTAGITIQDEDWHIIDNEQERQGLLLIIRDLVALFEQAKTFGSLITVPNSISEYLPTLKRIVNQVIDSGDLFSKSAAEALIPIIKQAEILANQYDAVVANPPYMGGKGMNPALKKFAKDNYPNSKSDLFAIFMEHGFSFLKENGFNAQVNMQSWMFLSSYEKLREWLLESKTFVTMAHLGARAFSQISGEVVQTTAWVLSNHHLEHYQPVFFRLIEGNEEQKRLALRKQENRFDSNQQDDFKKIPGSPIAYWVNDMVHNAFADTIKRNSSIEFGIKTGSNDTFLRYWHEISIQMNDKVNAGMSRVNYFDESEHSERLPEKYDGMHKRASFSHQNEYRIVADFDCNEDYLNFNIGDLSDIALITTPDKFNQGLEVSLPSVDVNQGGEGGGNIKLTDDLIRRLQVDLKLRKLPNIIGNINKAPGGLFEKLFSSNLNENKDHNATSILRKIEDSLQCFESNYFDGDSWLKTALINCCGEENEKEINVQQSELAEVEAYGQLVNCFGEENVDQLPENGGKNGKTPDFKVGKDLFVEVYCPDESKDHKKDVECHKKKFQNTHDEAVFVSTIITHPVTGNKPLAVTYSTNQTIARIVSAKRSNDQTQSDNKNILWLNVTNKLGLKVKDCQPISSVNHDSQTNIGCSGIWHSFYGQMGKSTFPKERFNIRHDKLKSDWYEQKKYNGLFRDRTALSAAVISCEDGIVIFQNPFTDIPLERGDLESLFKLYQFRPEYSWFDLCQSDLKRRVEMSLKNIELLKGVIVKWRSQ